MKTIKYIAIAVALIVAAILIFQVSKKRIAFVKDNQAVVERSVYDSLVAIANRPPVIRIDTIRDTIFVYKTIYEVDTVLIEFTNNDTILVTHDTLSTEYFKIFITDTIDISNDKVYRVWPYEVYPKTIIKYIEKEKPVIKEVYIDNSGLYYNVNIGGFKGLGLFSTGLTYVNRYNIGLGASVGFVYMDIDNLPYFKPMIMASFTTKF